MSGVQLGAYAADDRPVLAPIELERFARREGQGPECRALTHLLAAIIVAPVSRNGRNPITRAVIIKVDPISVQLLIVRFRLRVRPIFRPSQAGSRSATSFLKRGSTLSARRYLRIVFRDSPARRAILRAKR